MASEVRCAIAMTEGASASLATTVVPSLGFGETIGKIQACRVCPEWLPRPA
jgi:hypothetical protein